MALLPIQHQIPATSNFPLSAVARLIESLVAATVAVLTIGCLVKADILLFLGGFLSVPPAPLFVAWTLPVLAAKPAIFTVDKSGATNARRRSRRPR